MVFLNLSAGEFLGLLGTLGGIITVLYFLDRSRRQKTVSTLRFWSPGKDVEPRRKRKRVLEPWSLLLQLLGLLLLLLAIAGLQWGSHADGQRNHVLLLDTSSASNIRVGGGTVLQKEKRLAARYVQRLSARDRVMLVRANALATPVTSFINDRAGLIEGVNASASSALALNIRQALSYARQALNSAAGVAGEIVYVGPGQVSEDPAEVSTPDRLRVIAVEAGRENCGITGIDVEPGKEAHAWRAVVVLKNHGAKFRTLQLAAQFAASAFAPRTAMLRPGDQQEIAYEFVTNTAGRFTASISPQDDFPDDNSVTIELPKRRAPRAVAYTTRAELLRPLLEANRQLESTYLPPSAYHPEPAAEAMILDRFAPPAPPRIPSLWLDPPAEGAGFPIVASETKQSITRWNSDPGLGEGLRARDVQVARASVFETFEGDVPVANIPSGPIAVARPARTGRPTAAAIGFDLLSAPARFEVTAPLLFANLLHWLVPDVFHAERFSAAPAGLAELALAPGERAESIRIGDQAGAAVPFTVRKNKLRFFEGRRTVVHVTTEKREQVLSLTLPEAAAFDWKPGGHAARGLPAFPMLVSSSVELWRWLAVLGGFVLAVEWFLFARTRVDAVSIGIELVSLAVLTAALFAPSLVVPETKTGVVVLVDVSNSITSHALAQASALISEMAKSKHGNWMKVLPFAAHTRPLLPLEKSARLQFVQSFAGGETTNLEAALTESMAAMPAQYVPRLVLFSDGNENQGSTDRAMAELAAMDVQVDTVPLAGGSEGRLRLVSVSMPRQAYAGEQIPIELSVDSPVEARAAVEISAEGKPLGESVAELKKGSNALHVQARVEATGTIALSGSIQAPGLRGAQFQRALSLKRATVLYDSEDPPDADSNLLATLSEAKFNIVRNLSLIESGLAGVQLVILNNIDLTAMPVQRKHELAEYVNEGGGLLLMGGERQTYKEDKDLDALDRALPAKLAPPKTSEGICVVLIVDKSSSMEGRKIELARLSASGVVDHLRPIDTIGVLIFDNSFQWTVPLRRARDKAGIKRSIAGITPDGGTQIAPALAEAYRRVLASRAVFKHIVLLTDGISEEGDSVDLAREALFHQVTISTVGLGQDVNRSYLQKIAVTSGGRSYFLNEPQGLEQILLKDVEDYSGTTAVEKPLKPIVEEKTEILNGVAMENAPALKGYARFVAKPGSDLVLSIGDEPRDPLYVRWQYGLGRAAVFASDAKSRWAQSWVTWRGFDKFWANVTRDLLGAREKAEAAAEFDPATNDVLVTYRTGGSVSQVPPVYVLGPNGIQRRIDIQKAGPGLYKGRLHTGPMAGLLRIRPEVESRDFPETGIYVEEQESRDSGVNESLLRELAAVTGGRFNPPPDKVFESGGRSIDANVQLWPGLLAVVIGLTILELLVRKRVLDGRAVIGKRLFHRVVAFKEAHRLKAS